MACLLICIKGRVEANTQRKFGNDATGHGYLNDYRRGRQSRSGRWASTLYVDNGHLTREINLYASYRLTFLRDFQASGTRGNYLCSWTILH